MRIGNGRFMVAASDHSHGPALKLSMFCNKSNTKPQKRRCFGDILAKRDVEVA